MAFKNFFKMFKSDEIEEEPVVDPIVEQRRKEKFSTPLIYDEEEKEEKVVEKKVAKTPSTVKKVKVDQPTVYNMTEIISPMMGKKETHKEVVKPSTKKVKKKKVIDIKDQLVPVISPYYGNSSVEDDEVEEVKNENIKTIKYDTKGPEFVTENLRNLAKIVQEEENQLKIIEARTGEFRLDFSNVDESEKTLIDEINDEMTLDELMSLYEKKKMNE